MVLQQENAIFDRDFAVTQALATKCCLVKVRLTCHNVLAASSGRVVCIHASQRLEECASNQSIHNRAISWKQLNCM